MTQRPSPLTWTVRSLISHRQTEQRVLWWRHIGGTALQTTDFFRRRAAACRLRSRRAEHSRDWLVLAANWDTLALTLEKGPVYPPCVEAATTTIEPIWRG